MEERLCSRLKHNNKRNLSWKKVLYPFWFKFLRFVNNSYNYLFLIIIIEKNNFIYNGSSCLDASNYPTKKKISCTNNVEYFKDRKKALDRAIFFLIFVSDNLCLLFLMSSRFFSCMQDILIVQDHLFLRCN